MPRRRQKHLSPPPGSSWRLGRSFSCPLARGLPPNRFSCRYCRILCYANELWRLGVRISRGGCRPWPLRVASRDRCESGSPGERENPCPAMPYPAHPTTGTATCPRCAYPGVATRFSGDSLRGPADSDLRTQRMQRLTGAETPSRGPRRCAGWTRAGGIDSSTIHKENNNFPWECQRSTVRGRSPPPFTDAR
jgi:hypothetical protein